MTKIKKEIIWMGIILIGLVLIYLFITKWQIGRTEYFQVEEGPVTTMYDDKQYSVDAQKDEPQNRTPEQEMANAKSVPMDSGTCENAADPVNVCMNYESCCTDSDNCVCQNPVNKDCQQLYKDCLEDKYLSPANMEYISTDKKDVICKKLKTNCCKSILYTKKAKKKDYDEVTMHMAANDGKILCSFTGEPDNAITACKQSCNLNDNCKGIIYTKDTKRCDIFDKPLVDKPGFLRNKTDETTVQFQRVEGFQNNKSVNSSSGVENGADYCYNNGMGEENKNGSCYEKNAIISDCRTQFDKCLTRDIAGLSAAKKKEHCSIIYGSCCSIVDGLDVVDRFKFLDPEAGKGNPKNKLCSWSTATVDECKKKCLSNPTCNYIYSNLGVKTNQEGVKKCDLYTGEPVKDIIPTFGKGDGIGNFVYKKAEINPDDELNETTTTMPSQ